MEIIKEPNIYLNEQETVNLIGTSELLNKIITYSEENNNNESVLGYCNMTELYDCLNILEALIREATKNED